MKHQPTSLCSLAAILSLSIPTVHAEDGWQYWFKDGLGDAKVVSGTASYKVEDGVLVGTTTDGSPNSFLIKGPFKDFELEFEVKVDDPRSGRLHRIPSPRHQEGRWTLQRAVEKCEVQGDQAT